MDALVRGKRVAIVGAGAYTQHLAPGNGARIDACDVVVRVNRGFFILNRDNAPYLGTKTDMVYTIADPLYATVHAIHASCDKLVRENVAIKTIPQYRRSLAGDNCILRSILEKQLNYPFLIDSSPGALEYLRGVDGHTAKHLNTGSIAVLEVLYGNPAEIFLTGFDFFASVDWVPGYRDAMRATVGRGGHDSARDKDVLAAEFAKFPDVVVSWDRMPKN